ncbi:hypothetical protein D3C80_2018380 [compost metagenome]
MPDCSKLIALLGAPEQNVEHNYAKDRNEYPPVHPSFTHQLNEPFDFQHSCIVNGPRFLLTFLQEEGRNNVIGQKQSNPVQHNG